MAVWIFQKMAASRHRGFDPTGNSAVWSVVPEKRKPQPKTIKQTRRGSDDPLQIYGYLKFSKMCEWVLRSVVGRWSSIFILLMACPHWRRSRWTATKYRHRPFCRHRLWRQCGRDL